MGDKDHSERMWPLVNEFMKRMQQGENPSIEEYCQRYPALAAEIRELFPTIMVVDALQPATEHAVAETHDSHVLPDEIGEYRILREIGRGGMGVVYEAEHAALGRRVALKVLSQRLSTETRALARFQREGRAVAKLHHTNIVPLFEIGDDGGLFFLAMQLIHGQSLDHVINDLSKGTGNLPRSGPRGARPEDARPSLGASDADSSGSRPSAHSPDSGSSRLEHFRSIARIGLQAAEALDYAHAREVIHRDIKPSNLILDESGVVWLTDFGLAKTDDEELTQTGDFLGTLRYMAPERFAGKCDERSDIYALGLTIYELLSRRAAFQASDRLQLIDSMTNSEPARLRSVNPRIPRDLETIVQTAIDKHPRSRYQSARAMADDLRRFLRDEPIRARRISPPERLLRWARRNKRLATTLCGIAALLVVVLIREVTLRQRAEAARGVAEQRGLELQRNLYFAEMSLAGQSASDAYGAPTIRGRLEQWEPQRTGIDLRGWEWYYLHALTHREKFAPPRLAGWAWSVDFNPTGTEYVHVVNGWGIQVRSAQTGTVLREKSLGSGRCVDWSPNGEQIAVSGFRGGVSVCDADTLDVIWTNERDVHQEIRCVSWSPDSKRLAASAYFPEEGGNGLQIWKAATGELLYSLEGHTEPMWEARWSPDGDRLAAGSGDGTRIWDSTSGQEQGISSRSGMHKQSASRRWRVTFPGSRQWLGIMTARVLREQPTSAKR